jgi:hypothetical protein
MAGTSAYSCHARRQTKISKISPLSARVWAGGPPITSSNHHTPTGAPSVREADGWDERTSARCDLLVPATKPLVPFIAMSGVCPAHLPSQPQIGRAELQPGHKTLPLCRRPSRSPQDEATELPSCPEPNHPSLGRVAHSCPTTKPVSSLKDVQRYR